MVNKFAGKCQYCGGVVPAFGGVLSLENRKFKVAHLTCADSKEAGVDTFVFSSGHVAYRNKKGRCEDAPCCGCCTI